MIIYGMETVGHDYDPDDPEDLALALEEEKDFENETCWRCGGKFKLEQDYFRFKPEQFSGYEDRFIHAICPNEIWKICRSKKENLF